MNNARTELIGYANEQNMYEMPQTKKTNYTKLTPNTELKTQETILILAPTLIPFPTCYWTVCYRTVCYRTVCYRTVCYRTVCYRTVCYWTVCYRTVCYRTVCYRTVCYWTVCYRTVQEANLIQSCSSNQPITFKVVV